MANIFRKKDAYIDRVNRSTFDLSFVNNLTMKFGAITPVCLLPASFGDSFQIDARFNLQLLPTVFPIQTQLYVRLHFVYVRTRTLWEDWMAFFGGDESVVPPFMDPSAYNQSAEQKLKFNVPDDLQTGTLADYLGVPTTITGTFGKEDRFEPTFCSDAPFTGNIMSVVSTTTLDTQQKVLDYFSTNIGKAITSLLTCTYSSSEGNDMKVFGYRVGALPVSSDGKKGTVYVRNLGSILAGITSWSAPIALICSQTGNLIKIVQCQVSQDRQSVSFDLDKSSTDSSAKIIYLAFPPIAQSDYGRAVYLQSASGTVSTRITMASTPIGFASFTSAEWTKPESGNCPFYTMNSSKLPPIPLSALPFRAYEAYYNAFGRDIRNNPFIVDGKPEYNKYVPSVKGGPDAYKYQLHYANWEPDAYTTALQSPQSGIAPLVGITSLGEATFRDASGNEYHAQLETADDGDTVTGFQVSSSNAPADVVRNLIGMATSGISISDFRNVNSLQRFLEIRIRQSPRYKNLVKGLFDVNLDYDELMMPEFLGGISDTIPVYKVTQTTPTEGNPLGSFAGQGSLQSGMRHVIRKYCPEDGYILGVMSVVPAANYSQLLPPHFTRMNLLDWHFPQFNNISYQPMLYKHLCPYQAFAVNPDNINHVFGYQRAYWDLISSFDEVHGEFRGSMRNFLINRVFDKAPELSKDFLLVNPDHVNDVFAMTSENGDKILGSIAFDITKKTTIPRNSIPHIE
nr:MAG TPA: Major capsid protein [Microviridae sp.]